MPESTYVIWIPIVLSIIAILFTLLKDFILPLFIKPALKFKYSELSPYRKENTIINNNPNFKGTYLRFMVKNDGRASAINCRCQIQIILKNGKKYGEYQGFPLRWAGRPEAIINQASGERLNIARGESEFLDLALALNVDSDIHLEKYHDVSIGIKSIIEPGEYDIILIFSGDNFAPYKIKFHIERKNTINPNDISLKLISYKN